MNIYCKAALHQINIAVKSIIEIIDKLEDSDLQKRPTPTKHSIGELLEHITMICRADSLIADGASKEEMHTFYTSASLNTLDEMKEALLNNYQLLEDKYEQFTEDELQQVTTSYWGITYTYYEWLLEIISHLYHHRGQLHAILIHCYAKDPKVPLFE
ncbi:DinB family protein [Sporosarcina limicola]|uniref:Damage-inducible protein DinB n=1 Tax=Sporosarcina limicola TaxID=34101 RepID=A0A927MFS5_9BACL|nr:DinB family protein [Sporosarcina limicola]MBE1553033.1 putative damage-inducible protein DinB [Sporosarcina limicola]